MAVHAAVGEQPQQVQPPARRRGLGKGLAQDGVFLEVAILDRLVDAREVLVNDAAGAQVEVADFAVAHLAGGQADIQAAGAQGGARVGA